MNLIEIGWPQVSGGCPYKVVISQWVPTRPEAMTRNEQMNVYNVTVVCSEVKNLIIVL